MKKITRADMPRSGDGNLFHLLCDECGEECDFAITMGFDPDYDAVAIIVCQPCLAKALELAIAN